MEPRSPPFVYGIGNGLDLVSSAETCGSIRYATTSRVQEKENYWFVRQPSLFFGKEIDHLFSSKIFEIVSFTMRMKDIVKIFTTRTNDSFEDIFLSPLNDI